ncbi:MAG: hypothetical protein ACYTGW_03420 [Planctomycetota bacterium]|jgi:hypothetical protein
MSETVETVAERMYAMVKEYHGKRKLKPMDLTKAMIEAFGDACDKKICKQAIRQLIDSGRCTYSYVGGSYIVLPPDQ